MRLLVDMNLSPSWAEFLRRQGFEAQHWSSIGDPRASDRVVMEFAREHSYIVFTHDLDFGNILAVTRAQGPSVIQVRSQDTAPETIGPFLISVLRQHAELLERGALITVEFDRMRARVLLLVPPPG